jgi:hypothetical protein
MREPSCARLGSPGVPGRVLGRSQRGPLIRTGSPPYGPQWRRLVAGGSQSGFPVQHVLKSNAPHGGEGESQTGGRRALRPIDMRRPRPRSATGALRRLRPFVARRRRDGVDSEKRLFAPGASLGVPSRCKDLTTSARSLGSGRASSPTKRRYFAWVFVSVAWVFVSAGCWISAAGKCDR